MGNTLALNYILTEQDVCELVLLVRQNNPYIPLKTKLNDYLKSDLLVLSQTLLNLSQFSESPKKHGWDEYYRPYPVDNRPHYILCEIKWMDFILLSDNIVNQSCWWDDIWKFESDQDYVWKKKGLSGKAGCHGPQPSLYILTKIKPSSILCLYPLYIANDKQSSRSKLHDYQRLPATLYDGPAYCLLQKVFPRVPSAVTWLTENIPTI